jgi:uncharacterized membrane protein
MGQLRFYWSRLAAVMETSVWLVPSAFVLGAVALSFGVGALDEHLSNDVAGWYLFGGGPDGARAVLSTIASSMMTFMGVVFSVTVLVLQLASNQFSPRVLRNFLRDRGSQAALGVFAATFAYSLMGLRSVRSVSMGSSARVPALTVWLALVFAGLCVLTFIYFLHHTAQSIRAVNVLARIGDETRERLAQLYPESLGDEAEVAEERPATVPTSIIPHPGRSGVVTAMNEDRLWGLACRAGVVLVVVPRVGDFIAHGAPLLEVWGAAGGLDAHALGESVSVDDERNLQQDVPFGLRQLVDVAERALSPGVNDPSTAVQALDQVHDVLRRLARQRLQPTPRVDERGAARLVLRRASWEGFVRLGLDEIRLAGAGSVQVGRRLRFLLEDLLTVAPPDRQVELRRQIFLLEASAQRGPDDDRRLAYAEDAQGQGAR